MSIMMTSDTIDTFVTDKLLPSMNIRPDMEGYSGIKSQMTNLFMNIILYIKEYGEVNINGSLVHSSLGTEGNNLGNLIGSVYSPVPMKVE